MVDIYILDVLRFASQIYTQARDKGIDVPKSMEPRFRSALFSQYREPLVNAGVDLDALGMLLGNKARWDVDLCRAITLSFMYFFARRIPNNVTFNVNVLLDAAYKKSEFGKIYLSGIKPESISEDGTREAAHLFLNKPRTFSIQAQIPYPNVSKLNEYGYENARIYKWLKLKYIKNAEGKVKVVKFPRFEAVQNVRTGKLSTRGQIEAVEGNTLQYTFCEIASDMKSFCLGCLEFITARFPDGSKVSKASRLVDFVNVMLNTNEAFVVRRKESFRQSSLFGIEPSLMELPIFESDRTGLDPTARINGQDEELDCMYLLFGERAMLERVLDSITPDVPVQCASYFDPRSLHIYNCYLGDSETQEPYMLILNTEEPLEHLNTHVALLEDSSCITDFELLKVYDFLDLL